MKKFLTLIIILILSGCTAKKAPTFPYQNGWMGADGIYSVNLPDNKTLWVFGDTFIQPAGKLSRTGSTMISNTIAITQRNKINYYWHKNPNGPKAFFKNPKLDQDLWPRGGFYHQGKIYLLLAQVKREKDAGAFGFKITGTTLAIISNINKTPSQWKMTYQTLPIPNNVAMGTAVTVKKPYVYLTASINNNHDNILCRIKLSQAAHNNFSFEYYGNDNHWHNDNQFDKAKIIFTKAATEMSLNYIPAKKHWLAIYSPGLTGYFYQRTASTLTGTWSKPTIAYHYPEMKKRPKNIFCYAAKAHQLPNIPLFVTYACNSFDSQQIINDISLYRPRVISFSH